MAENLIQVEPNKSDQARLDRMLRKLMSHLTPQGMDNILRTDIHPLMKDRVTDRFVNEGDKTVGGWAPLSEATQEIRGSMGFGEEHPINERTGQLRRFVESSFQMNKLGDAVELQMPGPFNSPTIEKKFRKAQQGKAPGSKIVTVPRPVLAVGQAENDMVTERFRMHIDHLLRSL
jgi:hypothetical protein